MLVLSPVEGLSRRLNGAETKNVNLNQPESDVGWHVWSSGEDIPKVWWECTVFFYTWRVSQTIRAGANLPFGRRKEKLT